VTGYHVEKRGFTGSVRANHSSQFALFDLDAHVLDRKDTPESTAE
jgi:hypothetical protein